MELSKVRQPTLILKDSQSGLSSIKVHFFFFQKSIHLFFSPNYTCWHLAPGLYVDTSAAQSADPNCDELSNLHSMTNRETYDIDGDLMFDGIRSDSTVNEIQTFSVFQEFWKPVYYESGQKRMAAWIGLYDGTMIVFPASIFDAEYTCTDRPWLTYIVRFCEYIIFKLF